MGEEGATEGRTEKKSKFWALLPNNPREAREKKKEKKKRGGEKGRGAAFLSPSQAVGSRIVEGKGGRERAAEKEKKEREENTDPWASMTAVVTFLQFLAEKKKKKKKGKRYQKEEKRKGEKREKKEVEPFPEAPLHTLLKSLSWRKRGEGKLRGGERKRRGGKGTCAI